MTRLIKALPIFLLLLVLGSCGKETQTFEPTESSTQMMANVSGIVLDEEGNPIPDVQVSYRGNVTMTNESGLYQYEGVSVDSKHNTVQITKDGYFEAARTFRSTRSQELFSQTILIRKQFNQSFNSSIGGTVSDQDGNATAPMVEITFPANAIVVDGTQDQYDGSVQVAIQYIDPTEEVADQLMPGDLSTLLADDILGKARTYGMSYVELQSLSGERLQIKEGATAQLRIVVPAELRSSAPAQVVSSYFDEGLGLWKEENVATLAGDSYVSEVTHFSCWSYNSSSPSVIVTARLVDQAGMPVAGMHIQLTEVGEWSGGYGYTDQDGIFTGAVAKDAVLNMYVRMPTYCTGVSGNLYNDEVGPFAIDTDLGDIAVDFQAQESVILNASFFNCDEEPVTNGIAHVARSYFKITDGTLNVTVPVCGAGNYILWAHDLDTDRVSGRLPLVVGQVNEYQDLTLCDTEAPFLEVIAPTLGIDERTMVEIGALRTAEDKTIFGLYGNHGEPSEWGFMNLNFSDANSNGFSEGAWMLTSGTIEELSVEKYLAASGEGEIVIEEVDTDDLGDYIVGYYSVNFTEVSTGTVHEFTGKFKLNFF